MRRKSWQDAAKAVERLIEQALSPKSAAYTSSFEVRSGFIPAESGKGDGLRLREDQDTVDNQPPSVDESKLIPKDMSGLKRGELDEIC